MKIFMIYFACMIAGFFLLGPLGAVLGILIAWLVMENKNRRPH